MCNLHFIRANNQAPDDGALQQEHLDEVEEKVCGDCEQVLGGEIQPNRGGRGKMYRGGRGVQIIWAAVGPVRRQLANGTT